jgi:hypothetical protein
MILLLILLILQVHFALLDESTWNAWLAEAKAQLRKA